MRSILICFSLSLGVYSFAHDFSVYTDIDDAAVTFLQRNRDSLFAQSGFIEGNVAVFGNSITQPGAFWAPFAGTAADTGIVPGTNAESYLVDKSDARNCAVSGYTIAAGLSCCGQALQLLGPEVVVCLYGTNDSFGSDTATFMDGYRLLLATLLDKGVVPIICTIPPLRSSYLDDAVSDSLVTVWNGCIGRLAAERNVVLADYWQGVMDYTGGRPFDAVWYDDSFIHPSGGTVAELTDIVHPGCGQGIHNAVVWEAVNAVYGRIVGRDAGIVLPAVRGVNGQVDIWYDLQGRRVEPTERTHGLYLYRTADGYPVKRMVFE